MDMYVALLIHFPLKRICQLRSGRISWHSKIFAHLKRFHTIILKHFRIHRVCYRHSDDIMPLPENLSPRSFLPHIGVMCPENVAHKWHGFEAGLSQICYSLSCRWVWLGKHSGLRCILLEMDDSFLVVLRRIKQREITEFLTHENETPFGIHRLLLAFYGEGTVYISAVCRWVAEIWT